MEKFFETIEKFNKQKNNDNYFFIIDIGNFEPNDIFQALSSLFYIVNEHFNERILSLMVISNYSKYFHDSDFLEKETTEKYVIRILDDSVLHHEKYYICYTVNNPIL